MTTPNPFRPGIGDIVSYDFHGHVIVVFPTGRALVHRSNTDEPVVYQASSLSDATRWITLATWRGALS